jgi:hypothetical protein
MLRNESVAELTNQEIVHAGNQKWIGRGSFGDRMREATLLVQSEFRQLQSL